MKRVEIRILLLHVLLVGCGVRCFDEAKNILENQLEEQPCETDFRFQPFKNWMNGDGVGCFDEARKILDNQLEEQPYRTAFHFQPFKNWMNDPNGPMYYNGVYHLFYQYNPYAAVWGNISWGHSVSYNLIDWIILENAINPSEPYDINGCWSGSVTILPDENKPVILYTGGSFSDQQVQSLAVPKNLSDPFLAEWVKSSHNPLLTPVDGIDPNSYRDPTTAWQKPDKSWRMIIGSQIDGHGAAILYKSSDFIRWERIDKLLHSSNKTGMWECPDFYPVSTNGQNGLDTSVNGENNKHVLMASFNDHDHYVIGTYDMKTDGFTVDVDFMDDSVRLRYDYGVFYASKTFYDEAKKRRILWGWVTEVDSQSQDLGRGWSGLQSIPRSILLDKNGKQLVLWPVEEVKSLRGKKVSIENKEMKSGTVLEIEGITASQVDLEVSFNLSNLNSAETIDERLNDPQLLCTQKNASVSGVLGPFGLLLLASKDLTEQTAIFFRVFRGREKYVVLMCSDQSRSSLETSVKETIFGSFLDVDPNQTISLRTLIDHSIIESFGGEGRSCITTRVYPKLATGENAHIYAFNNGTNSVTISSLGAWSMRRAQIVGSH